MTSKTLSMIFSQNKNLNYWIVPSIRSQKLNPRQREAMAKELIGKVCIYYNVSVSDVKGRLRFRNFVLARHMSMFLIRTTLKMKLKAIGMMFGRDHTTTMHAIKSIQDQLDTDELIVEDLKNLYNIL